MGRSGGADEEAFVVFSRPVAGEGAEYLLMVLVKYYPLVALGALVFRSHAVDWDTYENAGQEAFMRASAFGSASDIREHAGGGVRE
jgi:hypothetical protein